MVTASSKPTRILVIIMTALVVIVLLIARSYYSKENQSVDPRIVPARELYEQYNALAAASDYAGVIKLLDTIGSIYQNYPHYQASFETGVLENNRAAVYLTLGLSYDSLSSSFHHLGQDSLMALGEQAVRKSIMTYEAWLNEYDSLSAQEIRSRIRSGFLPGQTNWSTQEMERYLDNRVDEVQQAAKETPRRLSVSYTNLGIVYRYREDYQQAASCYTRALELWEDNLTAENNLNILLGKPLKKRSLLRKLFPKPKNQ